MQLPEEETHRPMSVTLRLAHRLAKSRPSGTMSGLETGGFELGTVYMLSEPEYKFANFVLQGRKDQKQSDDCVGSKLSPRRARYGSVNVLQPHPGFDPHERQPWASSLSRAVPPTPSSQDNHQGWLAMSAGRRENKVKPCLETLTGSNGMGGDVSGVRSRNSTGDDRGCPCQHTPSYPKREDMQRWCIDGMQPVVGTLHASEPPVVNLSPMQLRAWGSNDGLGGVSGHDGILDRKRVPASRTTESELMSPSAGFRATAVSGFTRCL